MLLTEKELERLTRRKRPSAQAQVLREAGIPYSMNDGALHQGKAGSEG
jgi:hypothetical protein